MPTVTPIEPRLRERDQRRRPANVDRRIDRPAERSVPLTVHREPTHRASVHAIGRPPVASPTLSERALAARFFPVAALVVAVDLATKAWASSALAERTMHLTPMVSLSLAYNRASAGGVSLGEHTRSINFLATGVVVGLLVMLTPVLTRHHRRAWIALALIVGAGLGNLASLAEGARGVVDFIALHRPTGGAWVLNVADVALVAGLALLSHTIVVLARSARRGGSRVRVH